MKATDGFTTIELLVALGIMLAISAGAFAALQSSPDVVAAQSEIADMHQRLRFAVDAVVRIGLGASTIVPYRWGGPSEDPPGTYRPDIITFVTGAATTTYWLKGSDSTATYQLMSWSGGTSADVPVVDNVVALGFEYLTDGGALSAVDLTDGPWFPDPSSPSRLDADLFRVHAIGVTLRVQAGAARLRGPAGPWFVHAGTARVATRWVPDLEARFRIAPRNLNLRR